MISCSCDLPSGITTVSEPREVTCRTPRICGDCKKDIIPGNRMYMWSMYDWDDCLPVTPHFQCEQCGDMSLNLMEYGYCFSLGEDITQQWKEYLQEEEYYRDVKHR